MRPETVTSVICTYPTPDPSPTRYLFHTSVCQSHQLPVSHSLFISCLCLSIRSDRNDHRHHRRCHRRSTVNRRQADRCNNGASRSRAAAASVMYTQTFHIQPRPSLAHYLLHSCVAQSSDVDLIFDVNRRRMDGWQHMYAAAVPQRQYFAFSLQWRIALQSSAHLSRSECNVYGIYVHVDGQCRRTAASNCW